MNRISIHIESDGFNQEQAQALAAFTATLKPTGETYFKNDPQPDSSISSGAVEFKEDQAAEDKPKKTRNRGGNKADATLVTSEEAKAAEVIEAEEAAPETAEEETDDLMGDEPEETTAAPTVTREMIRSIVSDKQGAHKDAIRGKLKDLGAENVTKLEEKHFADFHSFVSKLK